MMSSTKSWTGSSGCGSDRRSMGYDETVIYLVLRSTSPCSWRARNLWCGTFVRLRAVPWPTGRLRFPSSCNWSSIDRMLLAVDPGPGSVPGHRWIGYPATPLRRRLPCCCLRTASTAFETPTPDGPARRRIARSHLHFLVFGRPVDFDGVVLIRQRSARGEALCIAESP